MVETQMTVADLQKFCGTETYRPQLHAPFHQGDYTYATDGRVMVRVARLPDVAGHPEAPNAAKVLEPWLDQTVAPRAPTKWPASLPPIDCLDCEGIGRKHRECECCNHPCPTCDGTGHRQPERSICVSGLIFNALYIRLIETLPGLQVAIDPPATGPMLFKFDGGVGLVMPMRDPLENHIGPRPKSARSPAND